MTVQINVRLPDNLNEKLENLSRETGRSKSYYLKKSIAEFIEDREDYLIALARSEENNPCFSYDKVRKEFGLDD